MFFKAQANLPGGEKARIEFHLQKIAECIGFEKFKLPIIASEELLGWARAGNNVNQICGYLGKHLAHDVSGVTVVEVPEELEKCGGGG